MTPRCTRSRAARIYFCQNDPGDAVYIVRSGQLAILLATDDGRELVINKIGAGECFGDWLYKNFPSVVSCTCVALGLNGSLAAPPAAAADLLAVSSFLNPDGMLNLAAQPHGTFDLRGWNVQLDAVRGGSGTHFVSMQCA